MFDPTVGIWISEDPIGTADDENEYRYVKNSPTNATDPSGTLEVTLMNSVLGSVPFSKLDSGFTAGQNPHRDAADFWQRTVQSQIGRLRIGTPNLLEKGTTGAFELRNTRQLSSRTTVYQPGEFAWAGSLYYVDIDVCHAKNEGVAIQVDEVRREWQWTLVNGMGSWVYVKSERNPTILHHFETPTVSGSGSVAGVMIGGRMPDGNNKFNSTIVFADMPSVVSFFGTTHPNQIRKYQLEQKITVKDDRNRAVASFSHTLNYGFEPTAKDGAGGKYFFNQVNPHMTDPRMEDLL